MTETEEKRISEYDFVVRAIKKLRKPPYKGIHSVYSGFNQAFRDYFNKDPVEVTNQLVKEGRIATRPVKGGVVLYLPEDAPAPSAPKSVLEKILGEDGPEEEAPISSPVDPEDE